MDGNNSTCPICAKGHLTQKKESDDVKFGDERVIVDGLLFSICDACGSEVTSPEESRHNKRLILEKKKQLDGFLSGKEIRMIRKECGITQQEASKIFGGGEAAFSKYENGDLVQSTAMDRLLRVAYAIPEAYRWLASFAGVISDGNTDIVKNIINTTFDTTDTKPTHKMLSVEHREVLSWGGTYNEAANMSVNCNAAESA